MYLSFPWILINSFRPASCGDPRLISSGLICLISTRRTETGHLNHCWRPHWPEVSRTHNVLISGDFVVLHSPESIPNLFIIDCVWGNNCLIADVYGCIIYKQSGEDERINKFLQWPKCECWWWDSSQAQATTSCTEIQTIITIIGLLHSFLLGHFLFCCF